LWDLNPQRTRSSFSGPRRLCKVSSKSARNCDRRSDDRHTHTHTDRQTQVIL